MSGPVLLLLRLALVVTLYIFLGWALWLLWQDLRYHGKARSVVRIPAISLIPQDHGQLGTYRFTSAEVIIGRDPVCELHLDERTISVRHAKLAYHHSQWWVEDLHSRNGTYLNQEPVSIPVVLASGDKLRCGSVVFQIALGEESFAQTKNGADIVRYN